MDEIRLVPAEGQVVFKSDKKNLLGNVVVFFIRVNNKDTHLCRREKVRKKLAFLSSIFLNFSSEIFRVVSE